MRLHSGYKDTIIKMIQNVCLALNPNSLQDKELLKIKDVPGLFVATTNTTTSTGRKIARKH